MMPTDPLIPTPEEFQIPIDWGKSLLCPPVTMRPDHAEAVQSILDAMAPHLPEAQARILAIAFQTLGYEHIHWNRGDAHAAD